MKDCVLAKPTLPVVIPALSAISLSRATAFLELAAPGRDIDRGRLREELFTALEATGTAHDGSDASTIWHERSVEDPTHRELGDRFANMASAPDPFDPAVCTSDLAPELNGLVYNRWTARWRREGRGVHATLRGLAWSDLTLVEQDDIRAMARQLSASHKARVHANRPTKQDITTVNGGGKTGHMAAENSTMLGTGH